MFKRKNKKTGIQTPEYRKPTPPPPPTSGSNARKPSCNCGHQPTYTSTQNPPDTFSSLLKATSLQILPNDIGTVTYICPYETPCGWCTKWDKKCDKKIGCGDDKQQRGLRAKTSILDDYGGSELDDIRSGKGLLRLDTNLDPNKPLLSGIRKDVIQ